MKSFTASVSCTSLFSRDGNVAECFSLGICYWDLKAKLSDREVYFFTIRIVKLHTRNMFNLIYMLITRGVICSNLLDSIMRTHDVIVNYFLSPRTSIVTVAWDITLVTHGCSSAKIGLRLSSKPWMILWLHWDWRRNPIMGRGGWVWSLWIRPHLLQRSYMWTQPNLRLLPC